ncbi:hypothetical protein [Dactylosporangium sp. CS-033363]|uniref:hypothetical protein n=1 Tax=Dactylosporangium sp. CS-033363 TaxID=3239935 RepID=UPI003D8C7D73
MTDRPSANAVMATEGEGTSARRRRPDGRIVASIAFGVAGLFAFNLVFGPLAVMLGLWALRRSSVGRRGRRFAALGVLLGLADLVVLAILVHAQARGGELLHVPA